MAFNWLRGDRIYKRVILDSNALLTLFEYSIDLEKEILRLVGSFKIIIPTSVIRELNTLAEYGKGNQKIYAKASLELIKKYEPYIENEKCVDDSVLNTAIKTNGIVFTNDKELRKKLKEKSIPVIFLRAKNKLELE